MNLHFKHSRQVFLAATCSLAITLSVIPIHAEDSISDLTTKADDLQSQLSGIHQELLTISDDISTCEAQIDATNNEILRIQDSLAISQENENRQYENMKTRIQYMYENDNSSLLEFLFSADNISDFLNKADFIQNISNYDRDMIMQLHDLQTGIQAQNDELEAKQTALASLQEELLNKQEELNTRAKETSTDLSLLNKLIEQKKAERLEQNNANRPSAGGNSGSDSSNSNNPGSANPAPPSSGNGNYIYPSGDGVLTPEKGVVYFNGHRETYYSQKVLPGGGLNIPGRHVAPDGTIRDRDNYICVASVDYPWGTVVETSLGPGKVYDSGCASGTIDIYTDW